MAVTRVSTFRNPAYKADGPKSLVYTLRKYNIDPSKSIGRFYRNDKKTLFMKTADGSGTEVTAANQQNDVFFLTPMAVGTPPQEVMVNCDTGSADFWVWSTKLPQNIIDKGEAIGNVAFKPDASSTYKEMDGYTWQIRYGDGSGASGIVGTDHVNIGNLTVKNQGVELASYVSNQFAQTAGSGLCGLAWGSINTVQPEPVKTVVQNMVDQGHITQKVFTAMLGSWKDDNQVDKGESFYTFGGIDEEAVKASGQEIHYATVDNSQGFWEFESKTAFINGKEYKLPAGNKAMADTGTTLWMAEDGLCEEIYSQIKGAKLDTKIGGYVWPKNLNPTKDLPEITIDIGGKQFTVEKEHLAFADVDETGEMVFGGIQPRGPSLPFDILGDTFLMCVYAIFDADPENPRFGCVQRADPTPAGENLPTNDTNGSK